MSKSYSTNHQEEEIDLRKLLYTIAKYKMIILTTSLIATLLATIYVVITPSIYRGSVLIDIGEVIINSNSNNDKPTIIQPLETSSTLYNFIIANLKNNSTSMKIEIPNQTTDIIKLNYENSDKQKIKYNLEKTIQIILERHKEKALFFEKANAVVQQTQTISPIFIASEPINTKKQWIVLIASIFGLIFGIFLSLFLEFISFPQKQRKNNEF